MSVTRWSDLVGPYKSRQHRRRATMLRHALRNTGSNHCHLCGKELKLTKITIDHVIPISKHGLSSRAVGPDGSKNLRVCCEACNNEKSNMPDDYYRMLKLATRLYSILRSKKLICIKKLMTS